MAIKEMQKLFRPVLSELSNINDYMEEDKHIGKKKIYRFALSKWYMDDVQKPCRYLVDMDLPKISLLRNSIAIANFALLERALLRFRKW